MKLPTKDELRSGAGWRKLQPGELVEREDVLWWSESQSPQDGSSDAGQKPAFPDRWFRKIIMQQPRYIHINIRNEVERAGIGVLLTKAGYTGDFGDNRSFPYSVMVTPDNKAHTLIGGQKPCSCHTIAKVIEASAFTRIDLELPPLVPPLKIAGHTTTVLDNGLQVGCTFVPTEDVRKAAKALGLSVSPWRNAQTDPKLEANGSAFFVVFGNGSCYTQSGAQETWCTSNGGPRWWLPVNEL